MDFSQKSSHQLRPVTGVKNVAGIGEVHLQVPNMIKDIAICMLSDDDFSKEECEDLCQRFKNGLLKRPTVVEVEQKAQILHEDITKHWIPRELAYLQNLIDRANEKGWHKELFEYLEKRKVLQKPSEQSKLLTEVPKVTADALEPPQEQFLINNNSPTDVSQPTIDLDGAEDESVVLTGVDKGNAKATGPKELLSFQWVESETKPVPKTKSSGQTLVLNNIIELSDDDDVEETPVPQEKENENDFSCPKWQGQYKGLFQETS